MMLDGLRRLGILGINRRNISYTTRCNARRHYPLVDDKLATKRLCEKAGIPVPRLLAVARHHFEMRGLLPALGSCDSFVLKPARGAMGNGILVVFGREQKRFLCAGGREVSHDEFLYHASGIISGLYSLAGRMDAAMVEERLQVDVSLADLAPAGVPDIRVIVYRGIPVMAMMRLPTHRSGGRANLHQGAIGAGVDLVTGITNHAVVHSTSIREHPDSGEELVARKIPCFGRVLEIAVAAADETGLGYLGADVVIDAHQGPMILELNARPGLAIQLANGAGLRPRLETVDERLGPPQRNGERHLLVADRVALGQEIADGARRGRARDRRVGGSVTSGVARDRKPGQSPWGSGPR
jgi:alpha-L-glutamate ligase-like protein